MQTTVSLTEGGEPETMLYPVSAGRLAEKAFFCSVANASNDSSLLLQALKEVNRTGQLNIVLYV